MKRILYGILMLIITASLALPAAPVLADQNDNNRPSLVPVPTLIIRAAGQVESGQPLTITILGKYNHETIAGVSVYAVKTDDVVVAAATDNYTTLLKQYEALAISRGTLLGTTGTEGKTTITMTQTARYMLVAVKSGYVPGFTRLTVTLAAQKSLNVKSPGFATSGQPVTFTVTLRYSQQAVSGAALYAQQVSTFSLPFLNHIPRPIVTSADNTSTKITGKPIPIQVLTASSTSFNTDIIKADPADTTAAQKYADQIKGSGIFLGNTDGSGAITYTFNTNGYYIITAILDGYTPGFGRVTVNTSQKRLMLQTPASAAEDTTVTFFISENGTGTAVAVATLWMLHTNDIKGAYESIWESLIANKVLSDNVDKYKGWMQQKGKSIGASDTSGQVNYTFKESGTFLLVALKEGYTPGFGKIEINKDGQQSKLQLGLKAGLPAYINKPVTLKAFDKNTGQAVDKATIYGFKGLIMHPIIKPSLSINENGTATAIVTGASAANEISSEEAGKLLVQSQFQPILLGATGNNGELQYTFTQTGTYTLVVFKDGYIAGGCRVNVLQDKVNKNN